jgi:hypothetical protein
VQNWDSNKDLNSVKNLDGLDLWIFLGFWNQYQNMMEFTFGSFGGSTYIVSFGAGFSSQNIGNTRILGCRGLIGVEAN